MRDWQKRFLYFAGTLVVMALGLASRQYRTTLPVFVAEYAGDTLWALMVYLGLSVVVPGARIPRRAAIALAISYTVECSQLYHVQWIDGLRDTTLGGLVLGYGFVWTDLVCYTLGVAVGAVVDYIVCSSVRADSRTGSFRNSNASDS